MADLHDDRTVVVDRDARDASSPLGWIVLLVALLLVIMFFLTDGFGLFGNDTTDTTEIDTPTTTEIIDDADPAPADDTPTDTQTDPAVNPDGTDTTEPAPAQ